MRNRLRFLALMSAALLLLAGCSTEREISERSLRGAPAAIGGTTLIGARVQSTDLGRDALARVQRASVRLLMVGEDGKVFGAGSGTIVSGDGLILTNAHVADPTAPGLAAQYGITYEGREVAYLRVGVTTTPDEPVEYLYNARLLASDGYLDLALIRIHQTADGRALATRPVLDTIPIASADEVSTGDGVTIVGFPSVSDSETATVTSGELSSYVTDAHLAYSDAPLPASKAFFETTAAIRHGNSGGTAVNSAGALIGVPTRLSQGAQGDVSMRIRPVDWVTDLADAVAGGRAYRSPYLVDPTGRETVEDLGTAMSTDCAASRTAKVSGDSSDYAVRFRLGAADPRLDVFAVLAQQVEGTWVPLLDLGNGMVKSISQGGCLPVPLPSDLSDGQWGVALYAGPDAGTPVGESLFTVGPATSGTPTDMGDVGTPSTQGQCRSGAPVSSWPLNQAIYVPEVTRQAGGVLFPGGKAIVVANLGSTTGYRDQSTAVAVARAALRHDIGPWPIPAAREQRWVVVSDAQGTFWAMLAQRREPFITSYSSDTGFTAFENPVLDACETPATDYTLVAWFATDVESGRWLDYDSTTNRYTYTS